MPPGGPNAEKKLSLELVALAERKPYPTTVHEEFRGTDPHNVLHRGGSGNIPLMGMALLLANGEREAFVFWRQFFIESKSAFMGRELMSRIYGLWHLIAVLVVYAHGPEDIRNEARKWIETFCSLLWATSLSDGRTMFAGMRSAGHVPQHDAYEWVLAVVSGTDAKRWERGWSKRWEFTVLSAYRNHLRSATVDWREPGARADCLRGFRALVPVHLYRSERGACFWIERNVNSNTPPILAASGEEGKRIHWAPANGGVRIRQRFDDATTERVHQEIRYTGELYPSVTIPMPSGVQTIYYIFGAEPGTVPAPAPPPEEPPEGEPEPAEGSWWARLWDWIRAHIQ